MSETSQESSTDNFVTKLLDTLAERGALLDQLLMNRKELAGDVKSNGSLGCSDHEIIELRNMRKTAIKIMTMDYKRVNLGLFWKLIVMGGCHGA